MNGDDHDGVQPVDVMTPIEIRDACDLGWIGTLRRKRVCLFPGPEHPTHEGGITDFAHCLAYLGDSNALIFCAPHHAEEGARAAIDHYAGGGNPAVVFNLDDCLGLHHHVDLICNQELMFPAQQENLLTWRSDPNDNVQTTRPPDRRFWAHYSILSIRGLNEKLHLLHLGLRGDHAWLYFLQPNGIRVHRMISDPLD